MFRYIDAHAEVHTRSTFYSAQVQLGCQPTELLDGAGGRLMDCIEARLAGRGGGRRRDESLTPQALAHAAFAFSRFSKLLFICCALLVVVYWSFFGICRLAAGASRCQAS